METPDGKATDHGIVTCQEVYRLKSSAIVANCSRAASRSSAISQAMTSGA